MKRILIALLLVLLSFCAEISRSFRECIIVNTIVIENTTNDKIIVKYIDKTNYEYDSSRHVSISSYSMIAKDSVVVLPLETVCDTITLKYDIEFQRFNPSKTECELHDIGLNINAQVYVNSSATLEKYINIGCTGCKSIFTDIDSDGNIKDREEYRCLDTVAVSKNVNGFYKLRY